MKFFIRSTILLLFSSVLITSCVGSCSSDSDKTNGGIVIDDPNPPPPVDGTTLACEDSLIYSTTDVSDYSPVAPDSIPAYNVSREDVNITADEESRMRPNSGNNIKRLAVSIPPRIADGTLINVNDDIAWPEPGEDEVHPILVSYTEQVIGDYELGDGSADIGDPTHVDDVYVSLSLDNGKSWKKQRVGDSAEWENASDMLTYMEVAWDTNDDQVIDEGEVLRYPGHSHKSTMNVFGNNILVAWLDKHCPSGNPYELADPATEDLFRVNGSQGSINYNLPCIVGDTDPQSETYDCAPNGKAVYEVPYSCVWAARGVFDPATAEIEWRQQEQLTSGTRDANKIWIASAGVGYALAWQEDPDGLRSGGGAGPGDGWSGATANHGSDIWYSYITMADFDDVFTVDAEGNVTGTTDDPATIAAMTVKPKPATKFSYPVRITDNESCFFEGDNKLYCAEVCTDSTLVDSNNNKDDEIVRCITGDKDQLLTEYDVYGNIIEETYATLDGDTGASRPALSIMKTDADEYITILGYEETKGLGTSGEGIPDSGEITDIELEGKAVYFESFLWDQPVFISAGNIVNQKVPRYDPVNDTFDENDMIFENARRLVIMNQVDSCEMEAATAPYNFGFMYKQSFETQGGASDMYIRMNSGFTYADFEPDVINVSGMDQSVTDQAATEQEWLDGLSWDETNLNDYVGDNPYDNTFSPRAFLRGDEIYTGYAYTPNWDKTEQGNVASNFWIHRYVDDGDGEGIKWQGPQQVSFEQGEISALDPRFVPTTKGRFATTGLDSDMSNPNVLFMAYGTANSEHELDVYYSRSTDKGLTWERVGDPERFAFLSNWPLPVEEKEVQALGNPDGTMLFGVWLQESEGVPTGDLTVVMPSGEEIVIPEEKLGLESWLGRVDYLPPPPPAP